MSKPTVRVKYLDLLLKKADFSRVDILDYKPHNIEIEDKITINNVTATSFKLNYVRATISKDPFYIYIGYDLTIQIEESSIHMFNGDLDKVADFAEKNKENIVKNLSIPAKASLLISCLTSELGSPFITSPYLVKKELKNN